jgi:hypothetical protein
MSAYWLCATDVIGMFRAAILATMGALNLCGAIGVEARLVRGCSGHNDLAATCFKLPYAAVLVCKKARQCLMLRVMGNAWEAW